ncbi:MAG: hypothetical protein M3R25_06870 [Bacteroidota bacterium]|nr:hypothetical protein [Bacteroidota bacterium]
MTKKEIIERGFIDQYVLGLTSERESEEVERLALLYPEVQEMINTTRNKVCASFNRKLTQPALRSSFLTKRRMMLWSGIIISFFSIGFCVLCREHISLVHDYSIQTERLAQEKAKVIQLASFSKEAFEEADFLHALGTRRILLKGCGKTPNAEVMVFRSVYTGKTKLRVIDLPELNEGQKYQVWSLHPDAPDKLIGELVAPLRFDSLYSMDPVMQYAALQITSPDPATNTPKAICLATSGK